MSSMAVSRERSFASSGQGRNATQTVQFCQAVDHQIDRLIREEELMCSVVELLSGKIVSGERGGR